MISEKAGNPTLIILKRSERNIYSTPILNKMMAQKRKEFQVKNVTKPNKVIPKKPEKSFFEKLTDIPDNVTYKFRFFLSFLIFAFAFLIYSNTLRNNYALDDDLVYKYNKSVQKGFAGIPEIFKTTNIYGFNQQNYGAYRPLTQTFFAIEYQFIGLKPGVNHFISVIWYALSCSLFFFLMMLLFNKQKLLVPLLITILFVSHPIHTEVVANVKSRDEIISFFFGFVLAFIMMFKFIDTRKIPYIIFALLFYFFGLLSKENIITLFPLIPVSLYFFRDLKWKQILVVSSLFLIPFMLFIGLRAAFIESADDKIIFIDNFVHLIPDFITKSGTILVIFLLYLRLSFFPFPLSCDYSYAQISPTSLFSPISIFSLLLIIALVFTAIYLLKRKSVFSYTILFFLITLSIYMHIYVGIAATAGDRFLFLPSVAIVIAAVFLIFLIFEKFSAPKISNKYSALLILAICFIFSIKTFSRNFSWKDSFTLYTTDVKNTVNSAKVNIAAGEVLLRSVNQTTPDTILRKTVKQGMAYIDRGLEIYPGSKAGWIFKGWGESLLKDYKNSRLSLIEALKISNTDTDSKGYLYNDGLICFNNGDYKQAELNFKTLAQYVPDNKEYFYLLTEVFARTSKVDSAVIILKDLIVKYPKYDKPFNKLGEIYGRIFNNFDTSFYYLNKAYELNPANLETLRNLGTAYGIRYEYQKSLRYLLEAEKVDPNDKDILTKLSITYKNLGNIPLSNDYFAKAGK
jgi:protein O-mannosyl-transferase